MARSPSRSRSRSCSRSRSLGRARTVSMSPARSSTPEDTACPFLIRMFVTRKHTALRDFDDNRLPTRDEYHVYGLKSSTPTSLVQQLYAVLPAPYRSPVARYSFKHVYVDASEAGLYKAREMVSFTGREFEATVGGEGRGVAEETLDEYGFIKGDLISVAVNIPEPSRRAEGREREHAHARELPRDVHRRPQPARGGWRRDEGRDARTGPDSERWGRRSRSPVGRRDSWRGRA
ncbi:hypothetical protein CC85DRAFT_287343 [Cutaneotrichosporon oleaginosum]|uniref:Uncharacterized protein n=1 Tax=Cutaneotrichosporon oleaginosum TaxID=879819 RepID=A0A0J0XHN9_9TREE|nr:uncharacterized protein CC85DRAFT_287343 [Cutaneotrichosporon oleaginosum]KLT40621.1 hypothetical protein CC85DRAFT_287343 [Cutaneotrichosporon oleaginosum]TXT03943.1 hypothetical protein COLE_07640 [Cutaneotrichosporon oleaginosum]